MLVKININPFNEGNPMTMLDAAIVAAVVAFVVWTLGFFANSEYLVIAADPKQWIFNAVKDYLVNWAGTFVALAGLEQLIKRGKEHV